MPRPIPTTEPPAIGEEIALTIEGPVAGGQCIARLDGRVVFVRDALPGEQVLAVVTGHGKGGSFLRADVSHVLAASPQRVTPPCPIASECGGCDWQHASISAQREIKAQVILDALRRTGGVSQVAGRPAADALTVLGLDDSDGLHWRTRMRYAVSNTGTVGLRAARSHRIIPAANCPLAVTELSEEIPVSLPEPDTNRAPRALIAAHSNTGQTKQTVNERDRELLIERVGDRDFEVALTGFWQVHPQAPQVLVDAVLAAANVQPGDRVLDLYSGVGLFAAFLGIEAGVTGRVDAVEGDKTAVALAKRNLADLAWVHHHRSAVDSWITHSQREADVIVLDPPRSGAGKDVVEGIVRTAPRVVVYVACDPVALARDVKTFSQRGYALTYVRGLDLFPMTKHVETIAVFKPTPQ